VDQTTRFLRRRRRRRQLPRLSTLHIVSQIIYTISIVLALLYAQHLRSRRPVPKGTDENQHTERRAKGYRRAERQSSKEWDILGSVSVGFFSVIPFSARFRGAPHGKDNHCTARVFAGADKGHSYVGAVHFSVNGQRRPTFRRGTYARQNWRGTTFWTIGIDASYGSGKCSASFSLTLDQYSF
jgi:hypothetical protein